MPPWPPHLLRVRKYLIEAMRIMHLHGRMRCEPKPGINGGHTITIVIDVPAPDAPRSVRDEKREQERTRR